MTRDDHRRRYHSGGQLLFAADQPARSATGAGTRHRAGIGLSEISDVVFIVSRKRGRSPQWWRGGWIRNLSGGIRRLLFGGDENKDGTETAFLPR